MPELGFGVVPPLHRPWDPDDSLDFHAARLLVLLRRCGEGTRYSIDGRTKLAKLDFFVRYPAFLELARNRVRADAQAREWQARGPEVEAPMIRYRYGPWDPRYRQFLAFLRARQLIRITGKNPERVSLCKSGRLLAEKICARESFHPIVDRCDAMVGNLAALTGTALKDLVYELFPAEVGELPLRAEIRP
ncbi:hypothetical protein [Amycolatopsis pigmentata]|uniref:Uncharacterized protein n=1 Tax=Amycolatopsis pigmentata TaxID=450801 RepID=A0ABW5FJT3_9PSEU